MKKRSTWLLAIATVGIGIWVGSSFTTVSNASSQLGSADDPVVTKSYVDQQIQKALGGTLNTNNNNSSSNASNTSSSHSSSSTSSNSSNTTSGNSTTNNSSSTPSTSTSPVSNSKVSIVELRPGKKLIANAGTQVIVRTGKAIVYSDAPNGIIDITSGTEVGGSQVISNNHLLLFPRDGRGVTVDAAASYNATVMVIGSYGVQ